MDNKDYVNEQLCTDEGYEFGFDDWYCDDITEPYCDTCTNNTTDNKQVGCGECTHCIGTACDYFCKYYNN